MKETILFSLLVALTLCSYQQTSPLLIVGTSGRKTHEGYFSSKCSSCSQGRDMRLKIYSIRSTFTLFFISVLPYGKKKYYLKCPQCKNWYHLPPDVDIEKVLKENGAHPTGKDSSWDYETLTKSCSATLAKAYQRIRSMAERITTLRS